jgi:hypothetical protein
MSDETKIVELEKNRAYLVKFGKVEILALKLEGFKATQLGGTLNPLQVNVGGTKAEVNDWLITVKSKDQITMPYEVWAYQVAQEISRVTGSSVNTITITSNATIVSPDTKRKDTKP